MIDIYELLRALAISRPVFESEADFQDALARHIRLTYSGLTVVREVKKSLGDRRAFIDLEVSCEDRKIFIELKYKTLLSRYSAHGRAFQLKNQAAQDHGRYDFLKDFMRLESFVSDHPRSSGVAVLLTNDKNYWSAGRKLDSQDREFRLPDGTILKGTLRWAEGSGLGSIAGREAPIILKGEYLVRWQDYAIFSDPVDRPFRMLVVSFAGNCV